MITSVLNDVITMTALQSNRHRLEIVFDIDPKVPAVLVGDAEKISHVLKILVENSIPPHKAAASGVGLVKVVIHLEHLGIGHADARVPDVDDQIGLGINGCQTHNFEGLQKLLRSRQLTHVFIAQSEYEEDRAYYEELADTLRVVVIGPAAPCSQSG